MNQNTAHQRLQVYLAAALPFYAASVWAASAPYAAVVEADGPSAYYRFSDSLSRGNIFTNSGTLAEGGNATNTFNVHPFPSAIAGDGDKSQFFDMGTSYAMIPYNAVMNPDNTKPFTIEAWFYPASDQIGNGQCPLNNRLAGSASDRTGWVFFQRAPDDTYNGKPGNEGIGWNCRMYRLSGSSSGLDVVSQTPYELGQWTHVVVVYDPVDPVTNASLTIYINGVAANTNVWTGGPNGTDPGYVSNASDSDVALSFGAYNNTSGAGNNPYFGGIDEFAFYTNKLTPDQILAHYQNGTNANRTTPYDVLIKSENPVTHLRLNEAFPGPELAINLGDAHAASDGAYTGPVKHPGQTALAGRTDDGSFSGAWRGGGGTRVDIPWLAQNNPDASAPFTFEAWFRAKNDRMNPGPSPVNNRLAGSASDRTGWVIYQRDPNDTYSNVSGSEGTGYNFRMYTGNGSGHSDVTTSIPYNLGEWQHLVVTWEPQTDLGTTSSGSEQWQGILTAYVNGVPAVTNGDINTPGTGAFYAANISSPASGTPTDLAIGSYNLASGLGEEFEGDIDEVALYTNYVLTADQILAHYQNGTNSHAGTNYETLVLTAAYNPASPERTMPPLYLRFNEPAPFGAANSSPSGAAAGVLVLATNNANGPATAGFEPSNPAVLLDGTKGWVALNEPSILDLSGAITLEAWINPATTQGDPARIISHGPPTPSNYDPTAVLTNGVTSSNEVFLRIEGGGANYSVGTSDGTTFHGVTAPIPAGDLGGGNGWIYLVGTYDGSNWRLFRNGVQLASAPDTVGALAVSGAEWAIGSTGDGWGDLFAGGIDEVAIYGKALTPDRIQTHYSSAASVPLTLSISKAGNNYVVTYAAGTLQSSATVNGQYSDVSGASSPYTIPAGTTMVFYRLRQ